MSNFTKRHHNRDGSHQVHPSGIPRTTPAPQDVALEAITTANYEAKGALFSPLMMKFATAAEFPQVYYTDKADTHCAFYQYNPPSPASPYLPLGDYALINDLNFNPNGKIMLVANPPSLPRDSTPPLAHPTGFTWILDDKHSGNSTDIAFFWPSAPDGYVAMGLCVGINGATPVATNYYCVLASLTVAGGTKSYWSDAGAGWKSWNGDMSTPTITSQSNTDQQIVIAPTTMLSDQWTSDNPGTVYSVLSLGTLTLPIPTPGVLPQPTYDPAYGNGTRLPAELTLIEVIPCTAVADPTTGAQASQYCFGYLASQPSWVCINATSAPVGGSYQQSVTVGTSKSQSDSFENTSSITVGAETGVSAGDAGGVNASISVSYTNTMSVSGSVVSATSSEVNETMTLNLPNSSRILIWQKSMDIVLYNTVGKALNTATFQLQEIFMNNSD